MNIKIPIAIPSLTGNEKKYLNDCIDSGYVSSVGPYVSLFEELIKKSTDSKHVTVVSSGTCALSLSLTALNVSFNDLVIIPAYTFIATANAVMHCGASPWIFDISLDDWGLDANLLRKKLTHETYKKDGMTFHYLTHQKISAIVPVYAMGLPCNMRSLIEISDEFNIPIVLDAAPAIGCKYFNQNLGLHGSLIATLSFNGNKNVTSGGGGAILTNDDVLANTIKHISTTARVGSAYDHDMVGYNYRMTNLQAAVGCAQIENLENFNAKKKSLREQYDSAFLAIDEIEPFPACDQREGSNWLSGFLLKNESHAEGLIEFLKSSGIEARPFWKPIHMQLPYSNNLRTETLVADSIWKRVFILPSYVDIKKNEIELVIDKVINYFK